MRRQLLQEAERREALMPPTPVVVQSWEIGYYCEVGKHTEHHKCHMPGCKCSCHSNEEYGYGMYGMI